jgi:hypothetical protein
MTPSEIITAARNAYNAVGDNFWSDDELLDCIYAAELDLSQRALHIERVFTTTTTASTQEYDFPTNVISIKRVTYDGGKLSPISFGEDDALTTNNANTSDSGESQYYMQWNETIILRPIPDAAKELKVYAYVEPQQPSLTSTLEVPSLWHYVIVYYLVYQMAMKDQNVQVADRYERRYEEGIRRAKRWWSKRKRGDRYAVVKNEDAYAVTLLGTV